MPSERVAAPRVLDGRGVVVTGGSMGIGFACAEAALAAGARVLIAARGQAALDDAVQRLDHEHPGRVHSITADVSSPTDVEALFARALEQLGTLDGLIHAAAVQGPIGPALDTEPEAWLATLRTNLYGTFLVVRAAGRIMRRRRRGRIVLFSGGGATSPFPNYSAYACSKAAVVRLTETVAAELEPHGIAINCIGPGFVATRIHEATLAAGERAGAEYLRRTREELARGGVPASVGAQAAVFLLSDESEGVSGRLLAAPWDSWREWPSHVDELRGSDLFTLRRIVPRDRGADWQ